MSVRRQVALASIGVLAMGLVAGLIWLWLAEPAQWVVRDNGIALTEGAAKGQFSVIVLFVGIGVLGSLLAGIGIGWTLQELGWPITPLVIVLTTLAAILAWRIGVELGPSDPATVGGAVGDKISAPLEVDALAPFLVWPIAGLAGVVLAICLDRRHLPEV
ncbi:hypothetical protein [Aeromicrobium sp. P5_D10]